MNKMMESIETICQNINANLAETNCPVFACLPCSDGGYMLKSERMEYRVVWKNSLNAAMIAALSQAAVLSRNLLCTAYISPGAGRRLRSCHIQYADCAGNMYLQDDGLLILVENCAKPMELERKKVPGRAWTVAGLKLLFLLLTEAGALNWTYRRMAEYSGVSLGSVRYIMEDLTRGGEIIEPNGRRLWHNQAYIVRKWSELYRDKILPRLTKVRYQGNWPEDWQKYPLAVSGETSDIGQKLLHSNRFLAYQTGNLNGCILKNRWIKSPTGNIEIRSTFWPEKRIFAGQVPRLLIYADFMAEQDSRCQMVAENAYTELVKELGT